MLATAMLAVAILAVRGLDSERTDAVRLYSDNLVTSQLVSKLSEDLLHANTDALELLVTREGPDKRALRAELDAIRFSVAADLAALRASPAIDSPEERASVALIANGWQRFTRLVDGGRFYNAIQQLSAVFDPLTSRATLMVAAEAAQAKSSSEAATRTYSNSRKVLIVLAICALAAGLGIVVWLIRNIVPRVREYSQFAGRIARGDLHQRLRPTGRDELSDLGHALNDMVTRRQAALDRDGRQAQFVDAMQMTATEDEAHDLIKRHLERAVTDSSVTVLNRNNSNDRLEPVTAVGDKALGAALIDAVPRSCLAVRFARSHDHDADADDLIRCDVCGKAGDRSTCQPLLVGGEVIGSVLVEHQGTIDGVERDTVKDSVTQAAPVLANLRTLAIAENRAATDSLTGLPNKRSVEANLKRMVAQAARAGTPLTAILLDLDHFKQINDAHGHVRGDEALAAVGVVLMTSLRESDFAGRYGGEEFLLLLPDTPAYGALKIAEEIRQTIANITLAGVERGVTASLGTAIFPADAGDADTLVRHADRALYRAKSNGRNRTETFATPTGDDPLRPSATLPSIPAS